PDVFRRREPARACMHRNVAMGCITLRKAVQVFACTTVATAGAAPMVLCVPDDRLESERQANRGAGNARAGSVQRAAGTPRRRGAALSAGDYLRLAAQRTGTGIRGQARGRWLR